MEDGRRTYDDIARQVKLTAPSVKRRVDRLRAVRRAARLHRGRRPRRARLEHRGPGRALLPPGDDAGRGRGARSRDHPEVVEAWSVTGEADAIARVRTADNADLERLIIDLQRDGLVERTRSQVVLSRLVHHGRD